MKTIKLTAQPIDEKNFNEYGRFFFADELKPEYSSTSFDWIGKAMVEDIHGASIGVVTPKKASEFIQTELEQHNKTCEMIIPLDGEVMIVVGKKDLLESIKNNSETELISKKLAAFIVPHKTVVSLNAGVWHKAPFTKKDKSDVLIIYQADTGEKDKIEFNLVDREYLVKVEW